MVGVILDLWGDPMPEKVEKRGRPEHVVTDEKRLRVAVLCGFGQSQIEIAEAMGISVPTLRKNYLRELRSGLAQKRAELLVRLWGEAAKGNVAAMKLAFKVMERSDMNETGGRLANREKPKTPKLGKKEQAVVNAASPDTSSTIGSLMAQRMAEAGKLN